MSNLFVYVSVARIKDDMWEQLECVSDYGLSADDSDVLTRRQSARYNNTPVSPEACSTERVLATQILASTLSVKIASE